MAKQIDFEDYADTPEFDFEAYADSAVDEVPEALRPSPPDASGFGDWLKESARGFGAGSLKGATLGASPKIMGATDVMNPSPFGKRIDEWEQWDAEQREKSPIAYGIGDFAGSIVPSTIFSPFAGAAAGLGRAGKFAANAADATLGNVMRGGVESGDGYGANTIGDAALGAAGGVVGQAVGPLAKRALEYGKIGAGKIATLPQSIRDAGTEWLGGTQIGRWISNPDGAIAKATGDLDQSQKAVFNSIADMLGADNLGTAASKATQEQRQAAVNAMAANAEQRLGQPISDTARQALASQVDQAITSGAESGATLGGALRLMVKDDPAAVSKRVMTAHDAWSPLADNLDPRATQLRDLAGQLRGDFEANKLNRAFGQGPMGGRAYDVGYMGKPGYAAASDIAANTAPLSTKVGDLREARIAKNDGYWSQSPVPAPVAVPASDLGIRPVSPETASAHDIYQLMQSGSDLPFPLDEPQLGKLWGKMDDLQAQYGPLGTKNISPARAGGGTKVAEQQRMTGSDDIPTGDYRPPSVQAASPKVEPTPTPNTVGASDLPPAPPDVDLYGFTPPPPAKPPSPESLAAIAASKRAIGRNAATKIGAVVGGLGGLGVGSGVGGAVGGMAGGLLANHGVDVAAAVGRAVSESGRKALSPGALTSSVLEHPEILSRMAGLPDALGRAATWVLGGLQDGGQQAVKARAFTLAMDPVLRSQMASMLQGDEKP